MKALILAAGLGSRLCEKTALIPKALVPVLGIPILSYQLESLSKSGIVDINMVVGYCGDEILRFSQTYSERRMNFTFRTNTEFSTSNSSYSFYIARDLVQDLSYVHINCDILFSANTVIRLLDYDHPDVIVLDGRIQLGDQMEQVQLKGNQIVEMRNMPFNGASGKAVGLAKLSKETVSWICERIAQYVAEGDKTQNFYGILREAVKVHDIRGMWAEDPIYEINTLSDLARVEVEIGHHWS